MVVMIVLLIFIKPHLTFSFDSGGLVKPTVKGNPAVLHNCTDDQDSIMQQCYLDLFSAYGMNFTSLPGGSEDPFSKIRYDNVNINFANLMECHSDVIDNCLNFNTFYVILKTDDDADYYISQTAFLKFYCDYGRDFINYYECMQRIEDDVLANTIYTECTVLEVGSCGSVSLSTQCESAVVRKTCSDSTVHSYCQYQKILMGMTGWNHCDYMPCINNSFKSHYLLFLMLLISMCL
ncbi:unnamed protein product [Caenorhabditis bovis]|uniref:DUF19 domain-containing protein n=1 Tax=Caenorhabditis bovis TaxID=2654633 RepID=A0A8S1EXB8_9PELO|nr:unnamed protein product [Caenorhabditis bovis]